MTKKEYIKMTKKEYIKIGETRVSNKGGKGTRLQARYYTPEISRNKYNPKDLNAMKKLNDAQNTTPPTEIEEGDQLELLGEGKDLNFIKKTKKGGVEIGVPVAQFKRKQGGK